MSLLRNQWIACRFAWVATQGARAKSALLGPTGVVC